MNERSKIKFLSQFSHRRLTDLADIVSMSSRHVYAAYESVELFSYIGGYMGMWLGWSLVVVFDFVEILIRVCRYPFIAKKNKNRISVMLS